MSAASEGPRSAAEIHPLAILAPSREVAQYLAAELDLGPREWFYVTRVASVLGVEPARYAVRIPVGTQLDRDADQALDYMIGRGWKTH
jgi:hypothetical protein